MSPERRVVVKHSFVGGRFEDHGLEVDVFQELIRYKRLVLDLAKELWRGSHPNRSRLPSHFDDELVLKVYEIESNCVTIPLERTIDDSAKDPSLEEALSQAVKLVAEVIEAGGNDQPFPREFPKRLLVLFKEYGSSLLEGERIEQQPSGWNRSVIMDRRVRENIARRIEASHDAEIDLVGTVTMARVNKPRMSLQLSDGQEIEAVFRPEHEKVIVSALKDHTTTKIRVVGLGQFSETGALQRIVEIRRIVPLPHGEIPFDSSATPIWERFQELIAGLPSNAFDSVPRDGALHHDAYL